MRRQFPVKLAMQQAEDSPDVDTDPPVPPVPRHFGESCLNHTPGTPIGLAATCWAQWARRFAAPPFLSGARRAAHPGADLRRTRLLVSN